MPSRAVGCLLAFGITIEFLAHLIKCCKISSNLSMNWSLTRFTVNMVRKI